MKQILTIILLILIVQAKGQGLLDGFKILKVARENVSLGAEWINGVGVNGTGTTEDNITKNRSIDSYEMDKAFKQEMDLSVLSYFNLNANYLTTTSVNYKNLTIYTVRDFSKLNIRNGQLVVYECIKADTISIKFNNKIDAQLRLKLNQGLKNINSNNRGNFNNTIAFSGNKLFLAYRVFELGKTKVSEKEKVIKGPGMTEQRIIETKIQDYNISFNDTRFTDCVYLEYRKLKNHDNFENCERQFLIDVQVVNFKSQTIQGDPILKRFDIMNSSKTSFTISDRINSNIVTDYFEIYFKLETTFLVRYLKVNEKFSKIKIRRITTPIKTVKKPNAPGW